MAASAERCTGSVVALLLACAAPAQYGTTFAYTGEDAVLDALNTHHAHFGGISNGILVVEEENFVWPYLPALFFEYGYLVLPRNRNVNASLNVAPEVNFFPLFSGRVSGFADLVLLAEADNKPDKGFGLRAGAGYSVFGSTIGLTESSPVVRAGLLFGNIRITYMYATASEVYINHEIAVGIKFDW